MLILYTIDGCTNCHKAKAALTNLRLKYKEKNLLHDSGAAKELLSVIGEVRAPVLKSDDSIWSGKELLDYLEEESLYELKDHSSK